jgi:hypothetical protein
MNGALRSALHFYIRSRAQRWFFTLALLSLAARLLLLRMSCGCSRATSFWYFVSVLPALGFGSVSLMSSAGAFRMISSLRTVYLIPRSRTRLVVGMLLAQVLVAALVTVLVVALGAAVSGPLAWGSARGSFEYTFGIATLAVVAFQVVAGPSRFASALAGTLLLALLARLDVFMQAEIDGVPTPHVLTLLALAAWLAFAAWYRHTGPIAPAAAVWRRWPRSAFSRAPAPASRSDAIAAYLLDQASLWLACRRQLLFWLLYHCGIGCASVAMLWVPFFHSRHSPHRDFSAVPLILLFAISFATNAIAGCMARHSRALWLRSGDSRQVLFETAERLAWRALTLLGVPFFLIATAEWRFLPHVELNAAYPVAVYLTIAPCGLYSGLLNFTRTADLRFVVFVMIVAQGGVTAAVLQSDAAGNSYGGVPSGFWILPLGLTLLAIVLRRRAQRRWLTIDWLRHGPPRPGMGWRTAQ